MFDNIWQKVENYLSNLSEKLILRDEPVDSYLYVPFKKGELTDKTIDDIKTFKENARYKGKEYKILYHGNCNLSALPVESTIYVLGHGIDCAIGGKWTTRITEPGLAYNLVKHLPFSDWAYSVTGGKAAIPIDCVAKRMIDDGILESDFANIKLWFCDVNDKALYIAKRFMEYFEDYKTPLKIDYYPNHVLYCPTIKEGKMHKWARNEETNTVVRASAIRQSLFSSNHPLAKARNDLESNNDEHNNKRAGIV